MSENCGHLSENVDICRQIVDIFNVMFADKETRRKEQYASSKRNCRAKKMEEQTSKKDKSK